MIRHQQENTSDIAAQRLQDMAEDLFEARHNLAVCKVQMRAGEVYGYDTVEMVTTVRRFEQQVQALQGDIEVLDIITTAWLESLGE